MQIPKSILLLSFVLQASFVPSVGARRLKSGKSSKSEHPKPVCFEEGYEIEPDFEGNASLKKFYEDCCAKLWYDYINNPWSPVDPSANVASLTVCKTALEEDKSFQKCAEKYLVSYPFSHYGDLEGGYFYEFEFEEISGAPLGKTAFRGKIYTDVNTGLKEKVILSYLSEQFDESKFNQNVVGMDLVELDYIEYSFKASSCQGAATECPEQFYLNVYTKDPNDTNDPYYNCRFDFIPDATTGDWTTVRFSKDTNPTRVECQGVDACTSICPRCGFFPGGVDDSCGAANTMKALTDRGVVLGLGSTANQIFALNIGAGGSDDTGLEGYYDRIVVQFGHEEYPRVYDL